MARTPGYAFFLTTYPNKAHRGTRETYMQFVDQGWSHVSSSAPAQSVHASRAETVGGGGSGTLAAPHVATLPSLHAFTPRVRVLVQCARLARRMRLSELSNATSVPMSELRRVEEGVSFPSNRVLEVLQSVLGIQFIPDA